MARTVCWFSCGAASAVAAKLTLVECSDAVPVYCATGAEHRDNVRFMADCERWFGKPVKVIRSEKYVDTWDVWKSLNYLSGIAGAPCTREMKFSPRLAFQRPDDNHVFGYTADGPDIVRAKRLRENFPELVIKTPLIDAGLTKQAVLEMVTRAGIKLPPMYLMGFQNNNCIPCVKATSPAYWALVRKEFPEESDRMAKLSRRLGARLARIDGERIFIDEIPVNYPTINPIQPSCDFLCAIAENFIEAAEEAEN